MTELLSSPLALFVGRMLLAISTFLLIYAMLSKTCTTISFLCDKLTSQLIAFLVAFNFALFIAFGLETGPIQLFTGFLHVSFLLFAVSVSKYVSGLGLMISHFRKRKTSIAVLLSVLFIFVVFLPVFVQLLQNQLGGFLPLAYNSAWLLDLCLTLRGAINGMYGFFAQINEAIVGRNKLSQSITIMFIIISIIVIPQVIPYSSIVTKLALVVGILHAAKLR